MADQATRTTTIDASPERCWATVVGFERYPDWARDVREATVTERDDDGRPIEVRFRAAALGRSARYTLAYDYSEAPRRLAWSLVDGDIMREIDGAYTFDPADGGGTAVTYHLSVELAIPLPGFVKRRAEAIIIDTALRSLKGEVERS